MYVTVIVKYEPLLQPVFPTQSARNSSIVSTYPIECWRSQVVTLERVGWRHAVLPQHRRPHRDFYVWNERHKCDEPSIVHHQCTPQRRSTNLDWTQYRHEGDQSWFAAILARFSFSNLQLL